MPEDMPPVVLLCGGSGTRMGGLTAAVPKPMLTVGAMPLLWHIMWICARHGSEDFYLALGDHGPVIKDFFLRFPAYTTDFTVTLGQPPLVRSLSPCPEEGWQVTCVDTGVGVGTGTRLRQIAPHVPRWPIVLAYGDVLADIDIAELVRYHRRHGALATVTAVSPASRFGELALTPTQQVLRFDEKAAVGAGQVSAGFFVLEREVIDRYIPVDRDLMLEEEPIREMVADGQLMAFRHDGYWQPIDTPKDLAAADALWSSDGAPWKVWR